MRKKTFVRKCYVYQSRLMLPFSSGSGQSTCGKSQEQNWLVSYSFKLTSPNKLVKKRKNKLDRLNEQNSDIYCGLNMEKNMGPRISLSNDPEKLGSMLLRKLCCTFTRLLGEIWLLMTIILPDIGLIYNLLTAKCIDLSLLINYSRYFKDLIQYYYSVRCPLNRGF